MKKMIVLMLLLACAAPIAVPQADSAEEAVQAAVVDVGNKLCPVMGGAVNGSDFVVYEGKRYGLCCPGCEKTFLSDPATYIAKINTQEASAIPEAEKMEEGMEQGSL